MKFALIHTDPTLISPFVPLLEIAGFTTRLQSVNSPIDLHDDVAYLIAEALPRDRAFVKLLQEQNNFGKPIIGIGEGAKFLVDEGFIPGTDDYASVITIESVKAVSALTHIHLSRHYQYNAFTRTLRENSQLPIIPNPNQEQFIIPPGLKYEMEMNGLNLFLFQQAPDVMEKMIAGVSNKVGNVLAILPMLQEDLSAIFASIYEHVQEGFIERPHPLYYLPR